MDAGRVEKAINMVEGMHSGIMKVLCCTSYLACARLVGSYGNGGIVDVYGHVAAGSASAVCPEDQEIPGAATSRDGGSSEGCFRSAALHGWDTALLDGLFGGGL